MQKAVQPTAHKAYFRNFNAKLRKNSDIITRYCKFYIVDKQKSDTPKKETTLFATEKRKLFPNKKKITIFAHQKNITDIKKL